MDIKSEILLGNQKNIDSVNVDNYIKIELTNNISKITEFAVNDIVNSTEVFDDERETNQIYRIYGRIEYLSLLNGFKYKSPFNFLDDYFNPVYTGDSKNILNSFQFYLVAPSSGSTYSRISGTDKYKRKFNVIATPDNFEIYKAAFSNNVYGDQVYTFDFNIDFDISNYYDKFGFPLTELFLYAQYISDDTNGEEISYTSWSTSTGLPSKNLLTTKNLDIGDLLKTQSNGDIVDIIEYNQEEYTQTQIETQKFFIKTRYKNPDTSIGRFQVTSIYAYLEWCYNPLIPIRLRYFDSIKNTAKLPEIVENSTTMDVYLVSNPTNTINLTKSIKQSITTSSNNINNWDIKTSPYYIWNELTGNLKFLQSGTYQIDFKTQIYLPYGTDKYIAKTYFQKNSGESISGTTRKYIRTNETIKTSFNESFNAGDVLYINISLIPNPELRKAEEIPDYALMSLNEGKYIWRDILPEGYFDPLTGDGVDNPFLNKRRYLFSQIILDVPPNLSTDNWDKHQNTIDVFNEISYSKNVENIDITPLTELDNIGKPCQ